MTENFPKIPLQPNAATSEQLAEANRLLENSDLALTEAANDYDVSSNYQFNSTATPEQLTPEKALVIEEIMASGPEKNVTLIKRDIDRKSPIENLTKLDISVENLRLAEMEEATIRNAPLATFKPTAAAPQVSQNKPTPMIYTQKRSDPKKEAGFFEKFKKIFN